METNGGSVTRSAISLLGLLVVLAGCRSALRAPPSLESLGSGPPAASSEEAERLESQAAEAFARRTPDAVNEAAELWTRAAAGAPTRLDPLVNAIRARLWLADNAETTGARAKASRTAVQTAQWCTDRAPGAAECDYWLGASVGVQARERRSTALDALPMITELFEAAREADPTLERGGPDRALALTYVRAPGWPTGPGDPDLGLEHAVRAVEIAPDYPPNHLALGEALAAVEEPEASREAYETALALARELLAQGHPDAEAWIEDADIAIGRKRRK